MLLKNPTNNKVSIVIDGVALSVEANSFTSDLTPEQARKWRVVHGFMEMTDVVEIAPGIPSQVDEQMLKENPVLAEAGVQVGDEIGEPTVEEMAEVIKQSAAPKAAKKVAKKK